jgi:aspartate-semialdehyde dehydrogenase
MSQPNIAIVGATGAVGKEFLAVLGDRRFPMGKLRLLASARSVGKSIAFGGKDYQVEELKEDSFKGIDLALFSAGGSISKGFAPIAVEAGAAVVDNSSAFRMTEGVPLVVPEVNPQALGGYKLGQGGRGKILANPNCSTIIMVVPVTPLHRVARVKRMVISTYQAASGAGAAAMAELEQQTREVLAGKPVTCKVFAQQYAFNLFSHNSDMQPNGYNLEEMKLVKETHKIWDQSGAGKVAITATCVRVPVMRAHAESINLCFEKPLAPEEAEEILRKAPGVAIINDREKNRFPTPLDASGRDEVFVGRIRKDISQNGDGGGLDLFVCGDQLRKGAALNAVQIAELLL